MHVVVPSESTAPDSRPLIRIFTFGPLRIQWGEQALPLPEERLCGRGAAPALALLKFLLCQPHRYALRDRIIEQFWPDSLRNKADDRLDDVASGLRTLLRPPQSTAKILRYVYATRGRGKGYCLESYPQIWTDADAFVWYVEQAVRMERFGQEALAFWEQAYQLASCGRFLLEDLDSHWVKQRRDLIEGHYRQCVLRLSALYREKKHTQAALLYLRNYCHLYPADEDALRPLLELLAEQECYQDAEAFYQRTRTALRGHEPDPRTEDVVAYVRAKPLLRQLSVEG